MTVFQDHLSRCISQGSLEKKNQYGIYLSVYLSIHLPTYLPTYPPIYYKELVHTIMEAGKFTFRKANGPVLVQRSESAVEPGRADIPV